MSSLDVGPALAPEPPAAAVLGGRLHVYVAFDWGDEIDLEHAGRLAPGAALALSRRPRTPSSFTYKPPPLRFRVAPAPIDLPPGQPTTSEAAEVTVFDFAAVSVSFCVPFRLTPAELSALAGHLATPAAGAALVQAARAAVRPLHEKLLPVIQAPLWKDDLWEEYFVFQFPPGEPLTPEALLGERAGWLAGLLRLEDQPLSAEEAAEALRLPLRYGRHDLFLPDWGAAVLLDHEQECKETLQTVEFANLQLLEYRHIDDRLDAALAGASRTVRRGRLPFWRSHAAPLRSLGELKVEANGLFERTGNVLKLIGDQYLARVYGLLAARFHLREWERSIGRKLDVIEGLYKVVSDQTVTFRTEFMEAVVIGLILLEVLLAIFRH
jgi:hypothetical protein